MSTTVICIGVLLFGGVCQGNHIPARAHKALEKAGEFELFSLDPDRGPQDEPNRSPHRAKTFHGWRILGKMTIKEPAQRRKLIAAFEKGAAQNHGMVAACFNPRHGIRVTDDGTTVDFIICFECLQVQVRYNEKSKEDSASFLTTGSPQGIFDVILTEGKIPLAPKPS